MERSGPKTIGPYRVVRELGRGSYGAVYLAQREGEELLAAVKVLLRPDDRRVQARFQLEASVPRRLEHPGVPRVYAEGQHGGHAWYAMEYCPRGSLAGRLKGGPLAPDEAARVVAELARIVASAHAQGVLHRDLKPENVLFDEDDGVRLTDFGLARDPELVRDLSLTGEVFGTPHYMAPELFQGGTCDARSDVYALGVLLYEALAGRRPLEGLGLRQLLSGEGVAPALRSVAPEVPAELERLCALALSRRPEQRPSAAELAEALAAWEAEPPRADKLVPLLVLGLGALVVGLGVALWLQGRREPSVAAEPAAAPRSSTPAPTGAPTRASTSPAPTERSAPPTSSPSASPSPTPAIAARRWPSFRDAMAAGDHHFGRAEYAEATARFDEAARQFPDQPISRFARAHGYLGQGKHRAAVASIREGLGLLPSWPRARIDLRGFFGRRLPPLLQAVERAVAAAPGDRELRFLRAYCAHFSGRRAAARQAFARLAEEGDAQARLFLAR